MRGLVKFTTILAAFLIGVVVGGYLFADSQPRSFLAIPDCRDRCLDANELTGLLGSIGIQRFNGLVPLMVKETEKTVVIKHPFPQAPVHYVIIPKKDIRNIAELEEADQEYIVDALAVAGELARQEKLVKYRILTNGPGYQSVAYLHFHLMGNR